MDRYYKKWFFPLALPSMILFVVVILVPFLLGALYSFTSWRGTYFSGGGLWESFVGLQNYQAAFQNQKFLDAFWYTIKFTVIAVITINVTALALALMVTKISRLSGIFRTIFFLPNMLGGLALGFIWQFIFQIVFSQILFGPESLLPIPFLQNMTQDNTKALFALAILVTWQMAAEELLAEFQLDNLPELSEFLTYFALTSHCVFAVGCLFACYRGCRSMVKLESHQSIVLIYAQPISRVRNHV